MTKQTRFWNSMQGFAAFMLSMGFLVVVTTVVMWLRYNSQEPGSVGIPKAVFKNVSMIYGPIIVMSITGFKDVLMQIMKTRQKEVEASGATTTNWTPMASGVGALVYILGVLGTVGALGCVVFISFHPDQETATILLGLTAGLWAWTIGSVFDKFFKKYTIE